MSAWLGIDCGSVSLNTVLLTEDGGAPTTFYRRTEGRPLAALVASLDDLMDSCGPETVIDGALVTGSARDLLSAFLQAPAINEISAHSCGVRYVDPRVRTIIEIGGQDSKFILLEPGDRDEIPSYSVFRMNEICAAGAGAFLDEQAGRLGIPIDSFGPLALQSSSPAAIAGRCAVFAKTDMIHRAQEGTPLPDILMGVANALARNYIATLVKGDELVPMVSLQGGVMCNQAVVRAFKELLGFQEHEVVTPPYFTVMGALGCARLALQQRTDRPQKPVALNRLRDRAISNAATAPTRSTVNPLDPSLDSPVPTLNIRPAAEEVRRPLAMGLDIGSVSVKGAIVDADGHILREEYLLSRSRPLPGLAEVVKKLTAEGPQPDLIAVTGSGRNLAGRLIDADLCVNEITAQARAALHYRPDTDTVVEIGGQDSKWISIRDGVVRDFEMNRVCSAGTGSFIMEQCERIGLEIGEEFSDAAFASKAPSDLGNRCTVFMESDLIHHQNNGASANDLAAGVCLSVVQNYLERVTNYRPLGKRVLFLGGVAATPAVRAAFEHQTGLDFHTPPFYRVSGAYGAALKALDSFKENQRLKTDRHIDFVPEEIPREQFTCKGCSNRCSIDKYRPHARVVFHGGLCDRWEVRQGEPPQEGVDLFELRMSLLENNIAEASPSAEDWGVLRAPLFYEYQPFFNAFFNSLGIRLVAAKQYHRKQFEKGTRFLRVETCLPIKALAGQLAELFEKGVQKIFHPTIINERPSEGKTHPLAYCPYIQSTTQFLRGLFPVEWKELITGYDIDPDFFRKDTQGLARDMGFSPEEASRAYECGRENLESFRNELENAGAEFMESLGHDEKALVILGRPYHTADKFFNMNLGGIVRRLGIKALPSDLLAATRTGESSIDLPWRHQQQMLRVAQAIAGDSRLYPVLITFFGCSPDPFTTLHLRDALGDKPLLVLEMDEHTSRAGVITRLEAFLDRAGRQLSRVKPRGAGLSHIDKDEARKTSPEQDDRSIPRTAAGSETKPGRTKRPARPQTLYMPYMGEHFLGLTAAMRRIGIDAHTLPCPDEESEALGRPHLVGGECYPYALILGDYLKMAQSQPAGAEEKTVFYALGFEACRLGQFPVYIEKKRRRLGYSTAVIWDAKEVISSFGLSESSYRVALLGTVAGLNAFHALFRLYHQMRPVAEDVAALESSYERAKSKLFSALCEGATRQGVEEALDELYHVRVRESRPKPVVAVSGDYYTRVVSFANHDVYREIEKLGGVVLAPPNFSDGMKIVHLKDLVWSLRGRRWKEAAISGLVYSMVAFSEFKALGGKRAREVLKYPLDVTGWQTWKSAERYAHPYLSAGVTGPLAYTMQDVDSGADGLLNLITLNCALGTVLTASVSRALKRRPGLPMLTLVFDGLKKTNEKTRLEAFMEQVRHRFQKRSVNTGRQSISLY